MPPRCHNVGPSASGMSVVAIWCALWRQGRFYLREMETILTYGDAVITAASLSLLDPGGWLDDNLIAFYFECAPVGSRGVT